MRQLRLRIRFRTMMIVISAMAIMLGVGVAAAQAEGPLLGLQGDGRRVCVQGGAVREAYQTSDQNG